MGIGFQIASVIVSFLLTTTASSQRSGIRHIDFKNLTYPWDSEEHGGPTTEWHWIRSSPRMTIEVVNGQHSFTEDGDVDVARPPTIFFVSVTYGDLVGDGSEVAAVRFNYSTGGTANWDYLYVYKIERGVPKLCGWLQSGSRAYGGLVRVAIENNLLILDFNDGARSKGDCCSEGFIRVKYRWRGGAFLETGSRQRGDLKMNVR